MKKILLILGVLLAACGSKANKTTAEIATETIGEPSDIITLQDAPSIYVDLDFDGEKELVTGYTENVGTQRGVGRYTAIYKCIDGEMRDVTEDFLAKSPVFDCMD